MNNVVKTQFIGRHPFKPPVNEVDVSSLKITDDKPKGRTLKNYKYDPVFKQLDIGKSISCKPDDSDCIAQALRAYVKRKNKKWKISMSKYYTSTTSRIFVEQPK